MKLLSVFILIIAMILLAAGLWLWAIVIACLAWHLYTRDAAMLRRKLVAMRLLWRSDAFFLYGRYDNNTAIRSYCSELDIIQAKEIADGCIEQERAVEDVQSILNS